MKNFKIFSIFVIGFSLLCGFASAASDTQCIDLGRNRVCVNIEKQGNNYYASRTVSCHDDSCGVWCDAITDSTIFNLWGCDGSFYYDWNWIENFKINIMVNGIYWQISGRYNFSRWSRSSLSTNSSENNNNWYDDDDDYYDGYNDTLNISSSSSSLTTSQFARITIDTDDDYVGRVNFSLKYRSSTSNSWSSITRTSSTYVSDYSSVRSNGYYNMSYSDYGQRTLSNLVKFKKTGYYRIIAEDSDGNEDYVDIHVTSSSSYDNDTLNISSSSSSLTTSQFARITIDTDDDYVGRVNFSLKYRSSTSNSWSSITRTSSTYVSDYSSVRSNGYYNMSYSDYGQRTLSNLVKFKKTGYYRIIAEDSDGNEDYVDIHVTSSSSYDNDTLNISSSSSSLTTSQFARITIDTDDDYVGRVNFSLKYRSSTSNSWSSITRTSSTYVSDYSSVRSNGYYNMSYSDYGQRTLSNLVKFKKSGYYRIIAEDSDGNEDYVDIHVTSSSSSNYSYVDGFSEDEFEMVERIYNVFPSLVAQLKAEHPILKSNSSWNNLTNTFYANVKDVINDVYDRKFSTYDEFFSDFKVWYNRTINLIK